MHEHAADKWAIEHGYLKTEDEFKWCKEHADFWIPDCPRCEECCQHHYGMPVARAFPERGRCFTQINDYDRRE